MGEKEWLVPRLLQQPRREESKEFGFGGSCLMRGIFVSPFLHFVFGLTCLRLVNLSSLLIILSERKVVGL